MPKHIKLKLIRNQLGEASLADDIEGFLAKSQDQEGKFKKLQLMEGNFLIAPLGESYQFTNAPTHPLKGEKSSYQGEENLLAKE